MVQRMSNYFNSSSFFRADVIRKLAAAEDQKAAILEAVGDALNGVRLTGNKFIMATYISRETSKGGIIKADTTLKEDIYQSKVGLILATGPDAFLFRGPYAWVQPTAEEQAALDNINGNLNNGAIVEAYRARVDKYTPKIGDWIQHFPSDTRLLGIRGVACRLAVDTQAEFILDKPEDII
jgi:hypothetical protein